MIKKWKTPATITICIALMLLLTAQSVLPARAMVSDEAAADTLTDIAPDADTAPDAAGDEPTLLTEDGSLPDPAYINEFIRQHLEFVDSDIYTDIMKIPGAEGAAAAKYFDANPVNETEAVWTFIDQTGTFLTGGDVSTENGFEIAVSELMMASAEEGEYGATFAKCYANAAELILDKISEILDAKVLEYMTDVVPQDIQDLIYYIRAAKYTLQIYGESSTAKAVIQKVDEILAHVSTGFEKYIGDLKIMDFLSDVGTGLDFMDAAADTISNSYSEYLRSFALYSACLSASDEWSNMWNDIAFYAATDGSEGGIRLFKAITKILEDVREATRSEEAFHRLTSEVWWDGLKSNTKLEMAGLVFNVIHDCLPPGNPLRAVMDGVRAGISLANYLTNLDSAAYYGEMAYASALVCRYAYPALRDREVNLREAEDYDASVDFDQAFCIYKEAQLYAFDYLIQYEQEYITAGVATASDIVLFYADFLTEEELGNTMDRIATTFLFQTYKAKWTEYKCHNFEHTYTMTVDIRKEAEGDYEGVLLYPQISLRPDSSCNETLANAMQASFIAAQEDLAASYRDLEQEFDGPFILEYSVRDTGLSGNAFGIRALVSEMQGMGRPFSYFKYFNYDIQTGQELAWLDIIDLDQEGDSLRTSDEVVDTDVREVFLQALRTGSDSEDRIPANLYERLVVMLKECYKQNLIDTEREFLVREPAEEFYTDAANDFLQGMVEGNFCFGTNGLCVSYGAGSLQQAIVGAFVLELPYSQLGGIIKEQYLPEVSKKNAGGEVRMMLTEAAGDIMDDGAGEAVAGDATVDGTAVGDATTDDAAGDVADGAVAGDATVGDAAAADAAGDVAADGTANAGDIEAADNRTFYGDPGRYLLAVEGDIYDVSVRQSDTSYQTSIEYLDNTFGQEVFAATHMTRLDYLYLQPEEESEDVYFAIFYSIYDNDGKKTDYVLFADTSAGGEPVLTLQMLKLGHLNY